MLYLKCVELLPGNASGVYGNSLGVVMFGIKLARELIDLKGLLDWS